MVHCQLIYPSAITGYYHHKSVSARCDTHCSLGNRIIWTPQSFHVSGGVCGVPVPGRVVTPCGDDCKRQAYYLGSRWDTGGLERWCAYPAASQIGPEILLADHQAAARESGAEIFLRCLACQRLATHPQNPQRQPKTSHKWRASLRVR